MHSRTPRSRFSVLFVTLHDVQILSSISAPSSSVITASPTLLSSSLSVLFPISSSLVFPNIEVFQTGSKSFERTRLAPFLGSYNISDSSRNEEDFIPTFQLQDIFSRVDEKEETTELLQDIVKRIEQYYETSINEKALQIISLSSLSSLNQIILFIRQEQAMLRNQYFSLGKPQSLYVKLQKLDELMNLCKKALDHVFPSSQECVQMMETRKYL